MVLFVNFQNVPAALWDKCGFRYGKMRSFKTLILTMSSKIYQLEIGSLDTNIVISPLVKI